ncbi:MAG TPA: sialidase family protein [Clostridia bacterium]|nr:sialidase family protein [Clostridia bacterium]
MKEWVQQSLHVMAICLLPSFALGADASPLIAWHSRIDIASGRGERGPWQQNESRYDYVDDPTVAIRDDGSVLVAWVDEARKDVFIQRLSANGTKQSDQPVNISRSPATFSWLPRVVLMPQTPEYVYMLWQEIIFSGGSHGGEIFFARSQDGGISFSQPINLSNSVGGDGKGRINKSTWHNGSLDLIASADGTLYAAWTEYDGQLWFSRSTDYGETFSAPQLVARDKDSPPARAPALALAPDGTLYLAWTVGENNAADIHISVSSDHGITFSRPRPVAQTKGYSDAPKLATDRSGVLHLVFAESSGGPFERYQIHYTRSTDRARTFEPSRVISKPAPRSTRSQGFPDLSLDGRGTLYVIWELFPNLREHPRGLGMAISLDAGRNFTPPIVIPGSSDPMGGWNGSFQGLLMQKLAVNNAGMLAIVNSSLKENERSRVWLMRGQLSPGDTRQGTARSTSSLAQ